MVATFMLVIRNSTDKNGLVASILLPSLIYAHVFTSKGPSYNMAKKGSLEQEMELQAEEKADVRVYDVLVEQSDRDSPQLATAEKRAAVVEEAESEREWWLSLCSTSKWRALQERLRYTRWSHWVRDFQVAKFEGDEES
jgi:hypothetical protein